MNSFLKKLIAVALLINSLGLCARGGHGGHGGGHHGGGHHGGHHSGHHAGHRSGHHGYNRGGHHGSRGYRHYNHGGRGYHHGGWNRGWGWGYPGWAWGATAALVAGSFLFGGYSINQWQQMAAQNPEQRVYYETVVVPAYQQYQQDPSSIPSYDADQDVIMADQDSSSMEIETNIDVQNGYQNGYAVRPCCTYENGTWYVAGRDRTWWDQVYPGSWKRFGLDERSPLTDPSFTDLAEQPAISGFERSIYTSPK